MRAPPAGCQIQQRERSNLLNRTTNLFPKKKIPLPPSLQNYLSGEVGVIVSIMKILRTERQSLFTCVINELEPIKLTAFGEEVIESPLEWRFSNRPL